MNREAWRRLLREARTLRVVEPMMMMIFIGVRITQSQ
jgi:hypothetical protein